MKNILFLVLSLFAFSLQAQDRKSLNECILLAWKQNPGFRNSSIHVKETRMDYLASIGNFLPRAHVKAEAGRRFGRSIDPNTNGYTTDTFDEGTVGLDMTLSLFEGFTRINRVRFEKLNYQKSKWELREKQNELAYRVTDTYYKVLLEEKLLNLAREQATLSKRYLKQAELFVELGLKSLSDLQEVKARREGDIYRCHSRENSHRLTLLQLKQLLNMQEKDSLAIQDTIDYEYLPTILISETEALYAQSIRVMPSYQIADLQKRAAQKQYAMAGGRFLPTIFARFSIASNYFNGYSSRQLKDNLGKYIGIGISFPLLSGLERLVKMRKQKLNIYRWQNEKEQTQQQLYFEVEQIVLSLHAGYQEYRQATLQLNAERLVLKESERKWEEGLISVFQLMEARNRFISAKAELTRIRLQTEMNIQLEEYYRTGYFGPHSL